MSHRRYHGDEFIAARVSLARESAAKFPRLAEIIELVCAAAKVRAVDVFSHRRAPDLVAARRAFAVMSRNLPLSFIGHQRPSFPEIAGLLGMSNHSTVLTSHDAAWRDDKAKLVVDLVCERLGVATADRPQYRTPDMPRATRRRDGPPQSRSQHNANRKKREKSERATRLLAARDRAIMVERKAEQLLTWLCGEHGIARADATGPSMAHKCMMVRYVFACIVRDTDLCGGMLTDVVVAEIAGRTSGQTAASWREMGRERAANEVLEACKKLGIAAPAYAVAAKGGGDCGAGREGGEGWTLKRR